MEKMMPEPGSYTVSNGLKTRKAALMQLMVGVEGFEPPTLCL
jgi:hypothetical protein